MSLPVLPSVVLNISVDFLITKTVHHLGRPNERTKITVPFAKSKKSVFSWDWACGDRIYSGILRSERTKNENENEDDISFPVFSWNCNKKNLLL